MEPEDEAAIDAPDYSSDEDNNDETRHEHRKQIRIRHKSDVYVAEGVYADCENILKQFLAKKTSTFEDFASIWQEKKFSLIFSGRDSYAELLEFSEETLNIAKSFILPPHSQIKRIGALYLMYGLYTQQPCRGSAKYRVTPQEWSIILKFIESLKVHGFIDANYIFHKMCLDGAFLTVAFNREYGLERNLRKYLITWQAREKELEPGVAFSLENLISRVYRASLKSAADKMRTKYNDIKKVLADKKETKFQSLKGTEQELEQVMLGNMVCTTDGPSQTLEVTNNFANLGQGRRSIIEKAFTLKSNEEGAQCTLLNTADTSAPSTSQANNEKTADSEDLTLELESENEGCDFEYVMNPPSLRNSKKRKSRMSNQGKSQDQTQLPSLGQKRRGPPRHDFAYEEVTGMKNKNRRRSTATSSEVVEKIDSCQGAADSTLTVNIDGGTPFEALPKGLAGVQFKAPTSGKGRRQKGKQSSSVSVSPLAECITFKESKVLKINDSCSSSETVVEDKPKKSIRRSTKSSTLNINDSCSSLKTPVDTKKKSARRSTKSTAIKTSATDRAPSSQNNAEETTVKKI